MFYVFNTLEVDDRTYGMTDVKRMEPVEKYQEAGFYGGRAVGIGITDSDVLVIANRDTDGSTIALDTAAEKLDGFSINFLRTLAKRNDLKIERSWSKEELVQALLK